MAESIYVGNDGEEIVTEVTDKTDNLASVAEEIAVLAEMIRTSIYEVRQNLENMAAR